MQKQTEKKEIEKELFNISKKIENDSKNIDLYLKRADLYVKKRDYDNAINDYDIIILMQKGVSTFYGNRANFYFAKENYEKALEDFNKELEILLEKDLESNEFILTYYTLYVNRGECLSQLEKYYEAIQNYTDAIEIFPDNSHFYYNRALLYDSSIPEIEDYDKAINDYKMAVELEPKNTDYYFDRAWLNFDFGKYSESIEDFENTIDIEPNHAWGYFALSFCYFKIDDEKKAIKNMKIFKKLFENEDIRDNINIPKLMPTSILVDSSMKYFINILEILLDLKKYYKIDYHTYSKVLDDLFFVRDEEFRAYLDKKWQNLPDSLMIRIEQLIKELFVREQGELSEEREHIFYIKVKLFILEDIFEQFEKYMVNYRRKLTKIILKEIANITYFYFEITKALQDKSQNFLLKIENEKAEAKVEERDRIIRSQAHNIKNILRKVIDPLSILQRTLHKPQIEEALKHADIIREMVNATSLSYIGSADDFFYDAKENENGISIKEMIMTSIETSVGNIVEDIKYYSNFWEQYFPNNKTAESASSEYRLLQSIPQNERYTRLEKFIIKYLFNFKVEFGNSELFIMGNQKSSGVKMLTLINELIFNAVKYVAFVEKEKRFISLKFSNNKQQITFKIENSCKKLTMAKTTGTGKLIIDNLIQIMNGKIKHKNVKDNIYINEIHLPNFWGAQKNE